MSGPHQTQDDRGWIANARSRLARRRAEKPSTKAAQIRALWPDIEAALIAGQSLKTICAWLAEDAGISVGVTSLTSYVSRIRGREGAKLHGRARITGPVQISLGSTSDSWHGKIPSREEPRAAESEPSPIRRRDPLANVRATEANRPGFHYRPATPEDAKKLI